MNDSETQIKGNFQSPLILSHLRPSNQGYIEKLFSSSNRFEVHSQNSNLEKNYNVGSDVNLYTNTNHNVELIDSKTIKIPPPTNLRGVEDIPSVVKD